MTKSQLVEQVAARIEDVPKKEIEVVVNTVFESMIDALMHDERVEIRGFGAFTARVREAREGRNPKTGEKVQVPRKRMPIFNAGNELKERVDWGSNSEQN